MNKHREIMKSRRPNTSLHQLNKKYAQLKSDYDQCLKERNDLREQLANIKVNPILITTMPKSGTYYLSALFSQGLQVKKMVLSDQYFPYDKVNFPRVIQFARGNHVSQDHFPASEINLYHISRYMDRLVCHIRDMRQALLSYVHYLGTFNDSVETHAFIYPELPDNFFQMELPDKIDWGIDSWLPLLVEWTNQWLEAADSKKFGLDIKITQYENLVANPQDYMVELLEFFDIPAARLKFPEIKRDQEVHFRKGNPDEWREVLSDEQKNRANQIIGQTLMSRFQWGE
ncbi:MAG: sulfotransferase domain-containing protein [Desulfarculaceae bacterium]|nr:sulfotransferase domain-containing protein [Desulfarculaceae bacterium]MCF8072935.1 sulfotransferase domain-containing protein [Desulfarculaceae bacterium]MCF8101103.1 sulfotransferase domain-containing protein [Desulfarculaceae bacterium]MCF8115510.1 sulfotransferase domain-containing protein [Desulfarculaceae bacterium]